MSRYYKIAVEVTYVGDEDVLNEYFTDQCGIDTEPVMSESQYASYIFEGSLCGGETEEQAHYRILSDVQGLEGIKVLGITTRWKYIEDWDEEFTSEVEAA